MFIMKIDRKLAEIDVISENSLTPYLYKYILAREFHYDELTVF